MSSSFELTSVDVFAPQAIGIPGARTFYLQVVAEQTSLAFKCEKQHVEALSSALTALLGDLPPVVEPESIRALSPTPTEWTVGSIALGYEAPEDRIIVILEEQSQDESASARFTLTRAQARAFIDHGAQLVAAGRPSCSLCSSPIDTLGYTCPCFN